MKPNKMIMKSVTESPQTVNLYVTYVEKEGPFLKIWGQVEKHQSLHIEQMLLNTSHQFELGAGKMALESLQPGILVCAKYKDDKYYRARILNNDCVPGFVEVNFLDYGNKDIVPCENIRSLQNFPTSFISIPPLAVSFIFAEAHCPGGGEWNERTFESIAKEIKYREVLCTLLIRATNYYLVKVFIDGADFYNFLIQKGFIQPISLQAQQAVMLSMSMQKQQQSSVPSQVTPSNSGLNTYKACSLEPGNLYHVYVSYVNDGPCHFSVQLKQTEDILVKLMNDINTVVTLKPLEDVPIPGTICLSKCQEDGSICRAVVTNEVDNQFQVFYVDFGNHEIVPFENLFQIPFKFVLPKVMAIRLSLEGVEKSSVTLEMQCAFKKFVDNRLLYMKILPSPTRMAVPKCELWDPETNTSAVDVVNRAARHAYPEPISLTRGFSQQVKVSYVYSSNRFYVQLTSKENELINLMAELQESCLSSDFMDPSSIKVDVPCSALFENDEQWYRAQIVEVMEDQVKVRYIDYGNEEIVPHIQLKEIDGEQLTVLKPQAIECCLNGYQNMELDAQRDALLEEIILEGNFTMKVIEMLDKKALVELFDSSNYNVSSLLLDKLAAAKSQVSPMLAVQVGNKLEHRKSFQQNGPRGGGDFKREGQGFRSDRHDRGDRQDRGERNDRGERHDRGERPDRGERHDRGDWQDRGERHDRGDWQERGDRQERGERQDYRSGREKRDWNSKSNDRPEKSWRQDKQEGKDFRNYDRNTNEDRGSWRQNNKGFSNKTQESPWNATETANNNQDNWENPSTESRPQNDNKNNWNRGNTGDAWNDTNKNQEDDWNSGGNTDQAPRRGNFNDRNKGDERYNNKSGRGDYFSGKPRDGGFRKREVTEHDSSGSEKSFKLKGGPRTSSRNDYDRPKFQKNFDKPYNTSFNNNSNDSWNVSAVTTPIDAAPATATFSSYEVVGTEAKIVISWFHNPGHFYVQLVEYQNQFKTMMEEIQLFYKSRNPEQVTVGSPVIGLFPEDNVLYRGQVLEVTGTQYKVYYIDFGNVSTVTKVWPIEKKFMVLPAQAIVCGQMGIDPFGETWPDADSYSQYFDKEIFDCQFINKDEVRTYVNLFYGQDSIAQQLIQANLAVYTQTSIPTIEVPLLLGQQFRAVVKSINNLSDIIIALECGMAVNCKMHNLETAAETFEDILKGLLEQTVIIYVDNVLDDKLEITIYDTEGNKINILSPDEGAYDNLEPICPLLVLTSIMNGCVSHAEENSLFIQPASVGDTLAILLDQMFEYYDNQSQETAIIPEEEQIYAVHGSDGNWYRGKVINFDDDKVTIHYIDYGNSEDVQFDALRELDVKFKETSTLCLQVYISTDASSFMEKEVSANIYYGENGWEGTVQLSESPGTGSLTLAAVEDTGFASASTNQNASEADAFEKTKAVVTSTASNEIKELENKSIESTITQDEQIEVSKHTNNGKIEVFASHIDSPNEFYLQLSSSLTKIEELQAALQEQVLNMPVLENPATGILCAAPYSGDNIWYRAEVLDADDDISTVRFVDFGNTDVIDNKTTQIKTLPSHLLSLAVYATRCSLNVKPIDSEWGALALEVFEALLTGSDITAEFLDQDEKLNYVELYFENQKLSEILIRENLASPAKEVPSDNKLTGFVSHLNSLSEFWIQLENCVDELEWIAEQLSAADCFPELEELAPGTLCAALFPDDQMWYRARILSNTTAGIELLFIDYGNSCISNSLKQLPEDLVITAPLALKCSLQKPEDIPNWTSEAVQRFSDISADGQTIFTVKKLTTGETTIVQLILNGEDIITKLLPDTEDGCVKNIESLDKFKIEIGGETVPAPVSLEKMPGTEWSKDAVTKLQEISNQGITLLQIEHVDEHTVRLYLNGSDIRLKLISEKALSANVSEVEEEVNIDTLTNSDIDVTQGNNDSVMNSESELFNSEISDIVIDHLKTDVGSLNPISGSENENNSTHVDLTESLSDEKIVLSEKVEYDNAELQNSISVKETDLNKVQSNTDSTTDMVSQPEVIDLINTDLLKAPTRSLENRQIDLTEKSTEVSKQQSLTIVEEVLNEIQVSALKESITKSDVTEYSDDSQIKPTEPPTSDLNCESQNMENSKNTEEIANRLTSEVQTVKEMDTENTNQKYSLPSSNENSRPSSRSSGRFSRHDDRVLPGYLSRPDTPVDNESSSTEVHELQTILKSVLDNVGNEVDEVEQKQTCNPLNHDDKIVPAVVSRPHSPILSTEDVKDVNIRPQSANSQQSLKIVEEVLNEIQVSALKETIMKSDVTVSSDDSQIKPTEPPTSDLNCESQNMGNSKNTEEIANPLTSEVQTVKELDSENTNKKKSLPSSNENSRPSSRSSGRFSRHDDRVLPGYLSRPDTPVDDASSSTEVHELQTILKSVLDNVGNEVDEVEQKQTCNPLNHDDKTVPAVVSRPHSPILSTEDVKDVNIRPQSANSDKIDFDDRIVPAVVSRTHSPIKKEKD